MWKAYFSSISQCGGSTEVPPRRRSISRIDIPHDVARLTAWIFRKPIGLDAKAFVTVPPVKFVMA